MSVLLELMSCKTLVAFIGPSAEAYNPASLPASKNVLHRAHVVVRTYRSIRRGHRQATGPRKSSNNQILLKHVDCHNKYKCQYFQTTGRVFVEQRLHLNVHIQVPFMFSRTLQLSLVDVVFFQIGFVFTIIYVLDTNETSLLRTILCFLI